MAQKIKTDVDRLLLVLIMKKKYVDIFCKIELLFLFSKPKVVYVRTFLFYRPFSQILRTKFCVFWTQTCRNRKSIKFANLLGITCP